VCGHDLEDHIDESNGWRCHALGNDGYQCECFLRREHADGSKYYYELETRINKHKEELR
jgi:hypothetical protein